MRVLTKEEQEKFIMVLEGEYYRPMFLTYLYTGMRMGEAIPLTWEDINLEDREIRVNKKAIICHNFEKHEAKTEISRSLCLIVNSGEKLLSSYCCIKETVRFACSSFLKLAVFKTGADHFTGEIAICRIRQILDVPSDSLISKKHQFNTGAYR